MTELKSSDRMLLERVAQSPVTYTHGVNARGATRLVRSSLSPKQQKFLHTLAVSGYLTEQVTGCPHLSETTMTYTLTALGKAVVQQPRRPAPPVHRTTLPTEEQCYAEGIE